MITEAILKLINEKIDFYQNLKKESESKNDKIGRAMSYGSISSLNELRIIIKEETS